MCSLEAGSSSRSETPTLKCARRALALRFTLIAALAASLGVACGDDDNPPNVGGDAGESGEGNGGSTSGAGGTSGASGTATSGMSGSSTAGSSGSGVSGEASGGDAGRGGTSAGTGGGGKAGSDGGGGTGGIGGATAGTGGGGTAGSDGGGGTGGQVDPCTLTPVPAGVDCCPNDPVKNLPGKCGCGFSELNDCLQHRYTFDGNGRVVEDVVGTAHGTALNATLSGGSIALAGAASDQYVALPAGLVSSLTSTTIEVWTTWAGTGGPWQRVFDFGSSDAATGLQGLGQTYLFLTPRAGSSQRLRVAFSLFSFSAEDVVDANVALPTGATQHVAVVADGVARTLSLYLNGALNGTPATLSNPLSMLDDRNNWIGRSQYAPDEEYAGSVHELRIYSSARSAADLQASFTAGPDRLPTQGGGGGAGGGGAGGSAGSAGTAGSAGMSSAGMSGGGTGGTGGSAGGDTGGATP